MLLSQNETIATTPHSMSPPSITITGYLSGPINERNLVSFHEP
jgi:hypothetical protein